MIPSSWIVRSYAALAPNGFSFAEPGGKYRIDPVTGKTVCLAKGEERQRAITTVQVFSAHFKASHPKLAVSDTPLTRMASNALSLFGTTHGSIDLVTDVRSEAPGLLRTLARNLPPKLHTTGPRIRAQYASLPPSNLYYIQRSIAYFFVCRSGSYRTPKGTASSVLSYDFLVSWL